MFCLFVTYQKHQLFEFMGSGSIGTGIFDAYFCFFDSSHNCFASQIMGCCLNFFVKLPDIIPKLLKATQYW